MVIEVISIIVLANAIAFVLMWGCGSERNLKSRTERELQIVNDSNKSKN